MLLFQLYITVCVLFLAGKDASSFKLKAKVDNSLTKIRIKRWHRDGVILNALFIAPITWNDPANWYYHIFLALVIRVAVFDPAFNHWAGLNPKFLGSTAGSDRFWSKTFGQEGALKKMIAFAILLLAFNLTYYLVK